MRVSEGKRGEKKEKTERGGKIHRYTERVKTEYYEKRKRNKE